MLCQEKNATFLKKQIEKPRDEHRKIPVLGVRQGTWPATAAAIASL